MCSAYWNLNTKVKCPSCKRTSVWELQTHWMGDTGSCLNYYELNENVEELEGIKQADISGRFIGFCPKCHAHRDFDAIIVNSCVTEVILVEQRVRVAQPG